MYKLVCLVGMPGAGKSFVTTLFSQQDFASLRFGQITIDILKEKNLAINTENEKTIREDLRKKHGMGAYALLNIPKIDQLLKKSNVIVDGLYSWSEYKILKEKYRNQVIVIAIYAPPQLRYERLEQRTTIDEKMVNRPISKEEAGQRDYAEIENIEKGGPIAMADHTILNTKGKEELTDQVLTIIKEITEKILTEF